VPPQLAIRDPVNTLAGALVSCQTMFPAWVALEIGALLPALASVVPTRAQVPATHPVVTAGYAIGPAPALPVAPAGVAGGR
jgi:hypothetical protein